MSEQIMDYLDAARVNLANLPPIEEMEPEMVVVMNDYRTSVAVKDKIQSSINQIAERSDHELTSEFTTAIDRTITDLGGVYIGRGGVIHIDGNEAFGFNITPSDWRKNRMAQFETMLEETYRDIKRWGNKLQENFQTRWVELTTSLEALESRITQTTQLLDNSSFRRDGCDMVEYNSMLVRSLTKSGTDLPSDLQTYLSKEITFVSTIITMYTQEMGKMKNSIVKFFGNPKLTDITMIEYGIPRVLNQRVRDQNNPEGIFLDMQSQVILGGRTVAARGIDPKWVKKFYKDVEDNEAYMLALGECNYRLTKGDGKDVRTVKANTLSLNQLFTLLDIVAKLVKYVRTLNDEYNALDLDKWTVKDNMETMKNSPDTYRTKPAEYQYVASNYQHGVNSFRNEITTYLTVLASHILTVITINLECYDAE